jgi:hypothetical protein
MPLVTKITIVTTVLFLWFNTNFVFYYYHLFFNKILDIPLNLTVPQFLFERYKEGNRFQRFFCKQQNCYKCIALPLSFIITFNSDVFVVYICSLILYKILSYLDGL